MKPKVFMTKEISAESLISIYKSLNKKLEGNVAVKVHTGEPGGHHFLQPRLIQDLVHYVNGTIIEANTAYEGKRFHTEDHKKTVENHGFTAITNVDIIDEEADISLIVENGKHLKENYVGSHIQNYDLIFILSHFKGHAMGGFGGAIKNTSIGIASKKGKAWIHSGGTSFTDCWNTEQNKFLESMVEAAKSITDYKKDKMIYINVVNNLSIDCDCSSNPTKPEMEDIGILASLDPVALDQACIDLIYQSTDKGKQSLIERIESRNGLHTLEYAEQFKLGTREYELIKM